MINPTVIGMAVGVVFAVVYYVFALAPQQHRDETPQENRLERGFSNRRLEPGEDCTICLEPMETVIEMHFFPCRHAIHISCWNQSRHELRSCPLCRRPF